MYLTGLDGDQISYATQASRTVTITCIDVAQRCKIQADILPRNYNHTEEKLYLGTNDQNTVYALGKSHQGFTVHVQFKLKYQYFDRLRDSVARVPSKVVSRIVPDGFPPTLDSYLNESLDLKPFEDNLSLKLCSNDQQDALKVMPISSCSKGEPPFLLTGPFGSGKTRLLALAAHISFRSLTSMHLLVCVQQHVSAGAFLSCFNDLASAKDVFVVQVVTESKYRLADYQPICKTVSQLQEMEERGHFARKKKVMVIATCSTANNLLYNEVFQPGYFTHIYIDEGAQMREPEAVAPLGFATEDTVLVIAGDQHQVCACVCVCVCVCVHTCTCTWVCGCTCTCVCLQINYVPRLVQLCLFLERSHRHVGCPCLWSRDCTKCTQRRLLTRGSGVTEPSQPTFAAILIS